MTKKDEFRYEAAEGCFIVRKNDGFIMGDRICLGSADSIDNYEDQPYTEESYKAFYDSIYPKRPRIKKTKVEEVNEDK